MQTASAHHRDGGRLLEKENAARFCEGGFIVKVSELGLVKHAVLGDPRGEGATVEINLQLARHPRPAHNRR